MTRAKLLAFLLLLSPLSTFAAPRHWYTDKKWWLGEAVIAGAVFVDYHSTAINRGVGGETNPFLGPHPTTRGLVIVGASAFTYWTTLHAVEWHIGHDDPNKAWRIVGYTAIPVVAAAIHGTAAAHNYSLPAPAAVREGLVHPRGCERPAANGPSEMCQ